MSLQKEIESVINCHSAENESDTPDFILAAYISDCLAAFNRAVNMRELWHGRKISADSIGGAKCKNNQ